MSAVDYEGAIILIWSEQTILTHGSKFSDDC